MAKIPFDIKFKPQIESGEYKIETEGGFPAKVMDWEFNDKTCGNGIAVKITEDNGDRALLYTNEGKRASIFPAEDGSNLFIITPEPELTEFEESIFKLLRQYKECDIPLTPENIKAEASMLWQDFEKYFFVLYGKEGEGDSALRSFYYKGLANGKAEALKDLPRWKKCAPSTIYNTKFNLINNGCGRYLMVDGYQIDIDLLLKKLPGFNED